MQWVKKGGRPKSIKTEDLIAAKALLKNPSITVQEVAKRIGVSYPTHYIYLPGGRRLIDDN